MSKKVLIIDDDIDLVEIMRLTLEKNGFEVVDAQDGQRGIEMISKEKPDLVILDI
ncbi:MAG: response regulator, partial [Candidatus Neomarinimicrobiota bacterium]